MTPVGKPSRQHEKVVMTSYGLYTTPGQIPMEAVH